MVAIASMIPDINVMNQTQMGDGAMIAGSSHATAETINNLNKALNAGVGNPPSSGGPALQVQSLEGQLRVSTYTLENIKAWKMIPKLPAFNTLEEYNLLREYGGEGTSFTNDGELAQLQDSLYERRALIIKYMACQREVTHSALLVRPAHGSIVAQEIENGAVWLLEQLERAIFQANSAVIPQAFDGIDAQFFADPDYFSRNVIDLRGRFPTEDDIENAAQIIVDAYGQPTDMFMTPRVVSQISRQLYPRERFPMPMGAGFDGTIGLAAKAFQSSAGIINFVPNVFLRPGRRNGVVTPPTSATSPLAPSAPTLSGGAPSGTTSYFTAADAGAYTYWATALNRFGESAATVITAPVTYTAGQQAAITCVATGPNTSGFRLYRAPVGITSILQAKLIREIPSHGVYVDDNYLLPGHGRAYMIQNNLNNWSFRLLAPMLRVPLATIAMSIRWQQLIYGSPCVYQPRRNVTFLNVPDQNS